ALARAGRSHQRDEAAALDAQAHVLERVHFVGAAVGHARHVAAFNHAEFSPGRAPGLPRPARTVLPHPAVPDAEGAARLLRQMACPSSHRPTIRTTTGAE